MAWKALEFEFHLIYKPLYESYSMIAVRPSFEVIERQKIREKKQPK